MTPTQPPLDYELPGQKLEPCPDPWFCRCGDCTRPVDNDDLSGLRFALGLVILSIGLMIAAWYVLRADRAEAHDAPATAAMPNGWRFDPACCGFSDCYPIQSSAVEETPNGYRIPETGEVIPYQSPKVRVSPDGMTYRCSAGGLVTGNTFCLYRGASGS